ncbi:cDNA FLJ30053 fis, clone ADRGL1000144, highly similar to StAR-related lipid transfer protein 7, related [Neospora caninum Liverpool]|nr:cDNA FLJ30053 fis, clone ADRGL1000144, highly similar to StAR-related lipid transfer protein 7, related [Neospora caninum Liverpool]CBZ54096.1 cDNA FLJ30053 fis, clone ADRGL1000144, highly similar to StAR-related lipid transfer protein 7, related [Neospora caninum Liverpool]|eukprot:XP_003884127.1 cDNA FLJ30053 fis, clone ADRGL1000144, highly similar to StAR-related lipid transfer protein 7, related [Neospora caninum Liverpool]
MLALRRETTHSAVEGKEVSATASSSAAKKRRRRGVPPRVPDSELDKFLQFAQDVRAGRVDQAWEPLVDGPPVQVWRRQVPGTNVHDYCMTGEFSDISASAYNTTFSHLPFRASWDESVVEIRVLEANPVEHVSRAVLPVGSRGGEPSDEAQDVRVRGAKGNTARKEGTGTEREQSSPSQSNAGISRSSSGTDDDVEEIIYWRVKLPWPLVDRDFVYARRFRTYPESHAIVSVQQATESPDCPPGPQAVRVESYNSTVVLFADNDERDINQKGVSFVLYHFDASLTPVPPWVKSYVTSHTLPRTIAALHNTAKALVGDDGSIQPAAYASLQHTLKFRDVHQEREIEEADEIGPEPSDDAGFRAETADDTGAPPGGPPRSSGNAPNGRGTGQRPAGGTAQAEDSVGSEGQASKRGVSTGPVPSEPERTQDAHPGESGKIAANDTRESSPDVTGSGGGFGQGKCSENFRGTAERGEESSGTALEYDEKAIAEAYDEIWKGVPLAATTSAVAGVGRAHASQPEAGITVRGVKACVGSLLGKIRRFKDKVRHSRLAAILRRQRDSTYYSNSIRPADDSTSTCASGTRPSWCSPRTGVFVATAHPTSPASSGVAWEILAHISPAARSARALRVIADAQHEAAHSVLPMRPSLAWPWWRYDRSRIRKGDACERQCRLLASCRTRRCSSPGDTAARRDGGAWDTDNPRAATERLRRGGVLSLRTYAAVEALRWAARLGDLSRDEKETPAELVRLDAPEQGVARGEGGRDTWIDALLVDIREDLWPVAILSSLPLQAVRRSPR